MTTLIAVYDSDGCRGRCDARCYEAKDDKCDCICGGRNHGAGRNQAIENTQELAEQWIDDYNQKHHGEEFTFKVKPIYQQMELSL
jgi:hypothetical protein